MCRPLPNITGSCARGADRIGGFGLVHMWLTNCYHDLACAGRPFLVGLDLITNPYHARDLGAHLPCCTFTNLYHRGLGLHIDRSVVAGHQHQGTGWARVIRVDNGGGPRGTITSGCTVAGRCR